MDAQGGDRQGASRAQAMVERLVRLTRRPATVAPPAPDDAPLVARIAHLEAELQALQDQVYRESTRHDQEFAELRHQLRPEEIARSLSDDTRRRGL